MINVKKKDEFVKQFIDYADANFELVKSYGSLKESMEADNGSMVKYLIKESVKAVEASVPEGIDVPKVSVYTNMSGNDNSIRVIDLTLRNKNNSEVEFKFKKSIVLGEDVFEVLADFLKCSWVELINDALIRANLEEVNAKITEIQKDAGNDFSVKIVSPLGRNGKKVVKITDDEIVFVADETRILKMDDILLLSEPSEFVKEEYIAEEYEKRVATFAKAQTTPQFIGVHDPLIGYICDISKLVKASTIINKVYSKNVKNLRSDKETYAYFKDEKVFSVVSVRPEGKDVVLKPFDLDSLEVVDYDVLAAI